MSAETLETARLKLRPVTRADAPRLSTLINDPDVARMTTRIPHPYSLEDAQSFLGACEASGEQPFAIDHREDGLIGVLGFHAPQDDGAMGPEVGYWLGRSYWGQGYATEALRGALLWASRDWGKRCLVSGHFADNPASGNVLIKAGFLYTGEVRRHHSVARGEDVDARRMVWLA
jgi:RimJ/RimL family protein N-acetyltransferase